MHEYGSAPAKAIGRETNDNPAFSSRASFTDSRRFVPFCVASILIFEFFALLLRARSKLFWYDEIIGRHVSGLEPFARVREALLAGADSMPMGYQLILRLMERLPIDPLISLRLPSIFGYLLSLLGVYWLVRWKRQTLAGLAAVLLMTLSSFRWYATEARGYSLMLGFLAVAAALWQRIGEKRFATPLFGLFLTCAVASHFLAVLSIACFGVAEIVVIIRTRRIRWGALAAFLIATIPAFEHLPVVNKMREVLGAHYWARTQWAEIIMTYRDYFDFGPRTSTIILLFLVLVVCQFLRKSWEESRNQSGEHPRPEEFTLIGAFLLYPAFLVAFMKIENGGYTARYGLPVMLGLIPAIVYVGCSFQSQILFRRLVVVLAIMFAIRVAHDFATRSQSAVQLENERWSTLVRIAQEHPDLPVVIASAHVYLEEFESGPRNLRNRTLNIADGRASYRLLGSDTADLNDLILERFIPFQVESPEAFLPAHSKFILQSGGFEDWLTSYLVEKGYKLHLVANGADGPIDIADN